MDEGEDDEAKTDVRALRMGWRRAAKKAVKASKNLQVLRPEGAVASRSGAMAAATVAFVNSQG